MLLVKFTIGNFPSWALSSPDCPGIYDRRETMVIDISSLSLAAAAAAVPRHLTSPYFMRERGDAGFVVVGVLLLPVLFLFDSLFVRGTKSFNPRR